MCSDDDFEIAVDVLRCYLEHLERAHRMIDVSGFPGCARCEAFREELGPGGGPLPAGAA